jgi:hypothetical protein
LIKAWYIDVWNTKMKLSWAINIHLKNEGQKNKTGPVQGWVPVRWDSNKEKVKKGEYGGHILCLCMKIEQ